MYAHTRETTIERSRTAAKTRHQLLVDNYRWWSYSWNTSPWMLLYERATPRHCLSLATSVRRRLHRPCSWCIGQSEIDLRCVDVCRAVRWWHAAIEIPTTNCSCQVLTQYTVNLSTTSKGMHRQQSYQWRSVVKPYLYSIKLQICMCTQTSDIRSLYGEKHHCAAVFYTMMCTEHRRPHHPWNLKIRRHMLCSCKIPKFFDGNI